MRWIFVHFISYDPTQPDNIYSHVGAVNELRTFTTYFSEGEKPHPDIMISSLHKMPTFPILSLPVLTDGFTTKTGWIFLGRKITLRTTAGKDRSSNVEIGAKAKRCTCTSDKKGAKYSSGKNSGQKKMFFFIFFCRGRWFNFKCILRMFVELLVKNV